MLGKIKNKLKSKKGFTLVELIVVIVIILVLGATLVPQLMKYVDQAKRANCQNTASTLLAQVQADYLASQATAQTGITNSFTVTEGAKIQNVTIKQVTAFSASIAKDNAEFMVKDNEVNAFKYNDGNFTATWYMTADTTEGSAHEAGWKID